MLTDKQLQFCNEYCVDFNGTQAAIRAGYSEHTAGPIASELLTLPKILERIEARKSELAAAAMLTPQWVLERWMEIATADPGEIMKLRRLNCRHCHGFGHAYQWTENEYRQALDKAIAAGKPAPDFVGGLGFNSKGAPHPDCPECGGEGVENVHIADTRYLKGNSRKLFAGVKKTKDGVEIKVRDQSEALANLAKYLGMSIEKKEITGANGGPIGVANLKADDLTDDQLAQIINAGVGNKE